MARHIISLTVAKFRALITRILAVSSLHLETEKKKRPIEIDLIVFNNKRSAEET